MRINAKPLACLVVALLLAACATPGSAAPHGLVLVTDTPAAAPASPTSALQQAGTPQAATGSQQQWAAPPEMAIDPSKIYVATFKTEKGDIKAQLFADKAPLTVNNFIFLARQGFYDNTTFHRVLSDFMAQGGDPTGTGAGGPGYSFQDEFHPDLRFDQPGLLAMANSGPDTNGSQFFLTFVPTPQLTGRHTIFGKVVEGMDVLLSLSLRDPQANPDFPGDKLLTVTIEEVAQSLLPPPTATPLPSSPAPAEGRPLADKAVSARADLYNTRPAMSIDTAKTYVATIKTTRGDVVVELYPQDAPESVNNFVILADLGYWDGFPIVFVQPDAFVLTGSPAGQPTSDIGYSLPSEVKRQNVAGAVGYWYRDDRMASSGSQVYILTADAPGLDGTFTVFGAVTQGKDLVKQLTTDDKIEQITIAEK